MEENQKDLNENKYYLITIILCFFLGALGAHRFYNKKMLTGILQLITLGGLGIWVIIDLILILTKKFKINNDRNVTQVNNLEESNKDWLTTFLLCWVLGMFGAHRFYNKKIGTGILQLLTIGGLGLWMLIDLVDIARHQFLDKDGRRVVKSQKNGKGILAICLIILVASTSYNVFDLSKTANVIDKENFIEGFSNEYGMDLQQIMKESYSTTSSAQVFMEYKASEEDIKNLYESLNNIEGITNIQLESKEEQYNEMLERVKGNGDALRGITADAFSVSYKIDINNKNPQKIIDKIEKLSEVREVQYKGETQKLVKDISIVLILAIYFKIVVAIIIGIIIVRTIISIACLSYIYKNKKQFAL